MEASVKNRHMQVRVLHTIEAVSQEAALTFAAFAGKYITLYGKFTVALSGGLTPRMLYSLLGSRPYQDSIDWQHVYLFWADERCVPIDDNESNFNGARNLLISKISMPENNIHRIKAEAGAINAARLYGEDLKRFFGEDLPRLDLIVLGIGEDGHTASLFPGTEDVHAAGQIVIPVRRGGTCTDRVSLALPLINNARHIIFLAAGKSKARVLRDILRDTNLKNRYPAGLIAPTNGDIIWFIDRDAASSLDPAG